MPSELSLDPFTRSPIPLRAHNLLCLQGFQGMGYDEGFTSNMARLHNRLLASPETRILVVAQTDHLCFACPHLVVEEGEGEGTAGGGCGLGGKPHEEHMRLQDGDVASCLGIRVGDVLPWREIVDRIAVKITPADLTTICTTCPWLPLGVCGEKIANLGRTRASSARSGDSPP